LIFEYLSTNTGIPMKNLNKKQLVVALLAAGVVGAASANDTVTSNADVNLSGNNDSSNGSVEGAFITSNGGGSGGYSGPVTGPISGGGAQAGAAFFTPSTSAAGQAVIWSTGTTTIYGSGGTYIGAGNSTTQISDANVNVYGNSTYLGSTTTQIQSANAYINTSSTGGGNTYIGQGTNALTMNGTTSINDSNNANTNINTGSSTGAVTIGNSNMGSTNTVALYSGNSTVNLNNTSVTASVTSGGSTGQMALTNNTAQLGTTNSSYNGSYTYSGGYQGAYNGISSTNTSTNVTGGTSNLLLGNNGATFSNVNNGAPIQVHGVADGTNNFDAVNVEQLNAIKMGIAGAVAMSNIPALDAGKNFSLGVGLGGFDSQSSVALGASARVTNSLAVRASVGYSFASNNSNIRVATWGVGAALGW
jgi:hypothetical protein